MSMSISKHTFTAGLAKVREFNTVFEVRTEDGVRIVTTSWHDNSPWYPTKDEARANVHLIAEAFTVAHETGLTPRQLAEQRAELLVALRSAERKLVQVRALLADHGIVCPCTEEIVVAQEAMIKAGG